MKILVVENDEAYSRYLCALLQSFDYETVKVNDEHQALEKCQTYMPDLILCYIFMPNMIGDRFIKRVRKMKPSVAIVAMTGSKDRGRVGEEWLCNADAVVSKPVNPVDLENIIKELLVRIRKVGSCKGNQE